MQRDSKQLNIEKFYDDLSQNWDNTRPKYTHEIFKKIASYLVKNNLSSVLDFGCGTGLFAKYVQENYPGIEVEGIDTSSQMIEKARTNCLSCQFYAGDIFSTALHKYDAIVSKDVFNHISDIPKTLSRLNELISPQGLIVIANRERESNTEKEITAALKSLRFQVTVHHFDFKPSQEEIESFLKTLVGFEEKHKDIIKERLVSSGKYYIVSANRSS